MALPTIASLIDAISLDKTVYPYLHQLSLSHVLALFDSKITVKEWYLSTNPLISATVFALFLSVVVFIVAEVNRNYSQVDRLWSLLPTFYIAHFTIYAHLKGLSTQRLDLLLAFCVLWSIRLTFNYWRKGGYSIGSEDYRWLTVKKNLGSVLFFILDLTFISFIQNLLLLGVATPAYAMLLVSQNPKFASLTIYDFLCFGLCLGLLLIEFISDQQQWNYQTAKTEFKKTGKVPQGYLKEDLERGFVVTGLWSYSRHPNFTCEQAIWIAVYLWSCSVTKNLFNWVGAGALGYWILFQASTLLTETLTAGKYSEYKEYKKLVGRFVPGLSNYNNKRETAAGINPKAKKNN